MEPNKLAEWGKIILAVLAAVGAVKYESTSVKKEVSEGVQKTRIADRAPVEYGMRDINARLFIVETALTKHFNAIRRNKRAKNPSKTDITLAEYALSRHQAKILKDDIRSAFRDVLDEIDSTSIIDE